MVLCQGTPEGSTGSCSGFTVSQKTGNSLKSHPTDWEKPGIEPATPFFVAFLWVKTSTGPGGFMICVFII